MPTLYRILGLESHANASGAEDYRYEPMNHNNPYDLIESPR